MFEEWLLEDAQRRRRNAPEDSGHDGGKKIDMAMFQLDSLFNSPCVIFATLPDVSADGEFVEGRKGQAASGGRIEEEERGSQVIRLSKE